MNKRKKSTTATALQQVAMRTAKYMGFQHWAIKAIRVSIRKPCPYWAKTSGSPYGVTDIDDHPAARDRRLRIWIDVDGCLSDNEAPESVVIHEVIHLHNWLTILPVLDEQLAMQREKDLYRLYLEGAF